MLVPLPSEFEALLAKLPKVLPTFLSPAATHHCTPTSPCIHLTPWAQEAVDSAEKWKQFAEGVQANGEEASAALDALRLELQVGLPG